MNWRAFAYNGAIRVKRAQRHSRGIIIVKPGADDALITLVKFTQTFLRMLRMCDLAALSNEVIQPAEPIGRKYIVGAFTPVIA